MTSLPLADQPAKRGTRLPATWIPSEKDIAYASSLGMTADQITLTAEIFHDYWIAIPGQRGVKLDWPATWRNWVRRDYSRGDKFRSYKKTNGADPDLAWQHKAARAKTEWGRHSVPRQDIEECYRRGLLTDDELAEALR